jgi:hypothetical protein
MTTVSNNDLHRDLGRVEATQSSLEERMDRFEKIVTDGFDKLEKKLDKSHEQLADRLMKLETSEHMRSGSWTTTERVLAVIGGGFMLFVGGIISYITSHVGGK